MRMTVRPRLLIIDWDKVPGAKGYLIYKDGVLVSSTKTATTARLPITTTETLFEIRPKGVQGQGQACTVKQFPVRLP
jgi:hypothetical protein